MLGKPPEHLQKVTPTLTFYWLPPQPSVHLMVRQFMQTLYEPPIMTYKAKESSNFDVGPWWCTFSDSL